MYNCLEMIQKAACDYQKNVDDIQQQQKYSERKITLHNRKYDRCTGDIRKHRNSVNDEEQEEKYEKDERRKVMKNCRTLSKECQANELMDQKNQYQQMRKGLTKYALKSKNNHRNNIKHSSYSHQTHHRSKRKTISQSSKDIILQQSRKIHLLKDKPTVAINETIQITDTKRNNKKVHNNVQNPIDKQCMILNCIKNLQHVLIDISNSKRSHCSVQHHEKQSTLTTLQHKRPHNHTNHRKGTRNRKQYQKKSLTLFRDRGNSLPLKSKIPPQNSIQHHAKRLNKQFLGSENCNDDHRFPKQKHKNEESHLFMRKHRKTISQTDGITPKPIRYVSNESINPIMANRHQQLDLQTRRKNAKQSVFATPIEQQLKQDVNVLSQKENIANRPTEKLLHNRKRQNNMHLIKKLRNNESNVDKIYDNLRKLKQNGKNGSNKSLQKLLADELDNRIRWENKSQEAESTNIPHMNGRKLINRKKAMKSQSHNQIENDRKKASIFSSYHDFQISSIQIRNQSPFMSQSDSKIQHLEQLKINNIPKADKDGIKSKSSLYDQNSNAIDNIKDSQDKFIQPVRKNRRQELKVSFSARKQIFPDGFF